LQVGRNGKKFEKPNCNLFTNNVAINFNMLGAFVEDGIVGYLNSRLIVAIEDDRLNIWNQKILEKIY